MKLTITSALPDPSIAHFVHSFWMVENASGKDVPSTVLPNGMVDLILMQTHPGKWAIVMRGIDTRPSPVTIKTDTKVFSIGFKLLAVEYLFGHSINDVLNKERHITDEFWQFDERDLNHLESFCRKATQKIRAISPHDIDSRKKKLFDFIYTTNGSMTVKELSEKVYWSSRQINRYFHQQFGIALKTYCSILRFGASLKHISEGKLSPERNFTDQNHFIKEVKKYAGVTPKKLNKNEDDLFIDMTAIQKLPSQHG
jgi:AraC-like DNA-binding protein